MQYPVGMSFNPDSVRNEMYNFWDVALSPIAVSKFLHTVGSGFVMASLFVLGVSAWYLLKNRDVKFAKSSMLVAASFGLVTSIFLVASGDEAAHQIAHKQPVKLAAMEGLYEGEYGAGLVTFGILNADKTIAGDEEAFHIELKIPYILSILGYHELNAYVPGLKELVYGSSQHNIMSVEEKMKKGKIAVASLEEYKEAKKAKDIQKAQNARATLEANMPYFGYGYIKAPEDVVPPVALTFYAFHIMVYLGGWFMALFALTLYLVTKKEIRDYRVVLQAALWSIPLGYIAGEAGWVVAEVGRQPWAIQDLMPVGVAATHISTTNVMISFFLFATLFTTLLIAEVKIMTTQIKNGPEEGH